MRALKILCVIALESTVMLAQNVTPTTVSDASSIAAQIKKLQDDLGEQQKAMTDQQKRIAEQQAEIEKLKQQLGTQPQTVSANGDQSSPHLVNAVLTRPEAGSIPAVASNALP